MDLFYLIFFELIIKTININDYFSLLILFKLLLNKFNLIKILDCIKYIFTIYEIVN